ncbi:MAG: hypothetical protein BWX73_02022 [Lentisphaerae bacterium ADurb.Bin082]|nr:MAG: hypothetical protein BWX73_02022 [Lentisphaerae bacterium ADurb.Bin082]
MVSHIEFLVEEPSMEAALEELLPRLLGETTFAIHCYQCKNGLLTHLPQRLRGYAAWLPQDWRIIVVVDRDDDDCLELKHKLDSIVATSGMRNKSTPLVESWQVASRLVIEELEAWYFGDWTAVCAAYPCVTANIPLQARYRDPDAIAGGTWEAFERILQRAGYFSTGLRKIEAARAIAAHWEPSRNTSRSFQTFCRCLYDIAQAPLHGA